MKVLRAFLTAGVVLACAWSAEAKTLALLVGVADYNEASGITDLLGPRNDVTILWRALKNRSLKTEDITVLTDALPQGFNYPPIKGLPESANILAELDRLAREVESGDTVVFYYSGHGTRQPADPKRQDDEPEADGMDQVLLPSDVGSYDTTKKTIRNAIVDNTLGDAIFAIRAKGAFVWIIIDACHAETITRGESVARCVNPARLGVPALPPQISLVGNPIIIDPNSELSTRPISRGGERQGTLSTFRDEGGFVGFYAVEARDQAIERPFPGYDLPMVGKENSQRMGVFTYQLHRALIDNTALTYHDLSQQIVAEMASDRSGGKVPPPVFDGNLDATIPGFGIGSPNSVKGAVTDGGISFSAGSLHGFDVGARLALYAPAKPDKVVGYADISEATAIASEVEVVNWKQGVDRPLAVLARIEAPAINLRFVLSPPPPEDFSSDAEKGLVTSLISSVLRNKAMSLGIEIGDPADPDADAMLRVKNGRLWIVRADQLWETRAGAINETPSLGFDHGVEKFGAALRDAVWRMARAAKLVRIGSALDKGRPEDDGLSFSAIISNDPEQDARGACTSAWKAPPGSRFKSLETSLPLKPLSPEPVGNCSRVAIEVKNTGEIDFYVSGFYVDSLGGIFSVPASATGRGCVRKLPAGSEKSLSFRFLIDTWDEATDKRSSTGAEAFVVLAIPEEYQDEVPGLCALDQPTLSIAQQTRDADFGEGHRSRSKLTTLISSLQGESTRGINAAPEGDGPKMTGRLFVFDVKP